MTGVVAFSLSLAGVPLLWGRITAAGAALTLIIYLIRSLPFTFGIHTVAGLLLLIVLIRKTTNVSISKCFIVVFVSAFFLAFLEFIFHEPLFRFFKISSEAVMSNDIIWAFLGFPQAITMIFSAVLISRFKEPDRDTWKI